MHRPRATTGGRRRRGLAPMPKVERIIWLPDAGEQQIAQALITQPARRRSGHRSRRPSRRSSRRTRRSPPTTGAEAALRLRRLVADLALRQQRARAVRRPGRPLGAQLLHRPPADRSTSATWRRRHRLAAADARRTRRCSRTSTRSRTCSRSTTRSSSTPKKGDDAARRRRAGSKDGEGIWVDAKGSGSSSTSSASASIGPAIGPVLVELLKRQGVDATYGLPPDFDDRFQKGEYTGALYGHGGSVNDPYYTLRLYQSATVAVPGAPPRQLRAVEERGVRQDRRRGVRHATAQQDEPDWSSSARRWRSGCRSCPTSRSSRTSTASR